MLAALRANEFIELFRVFMPPDRQWRTAVDERSREALPSFADETQGAGKNAADLLHALVVRKARLEIEPGTVDELQGRMKRGASLAAEDGVAAREIVQQLKLPIQQPHGPARSR